MMKGKKIFWVFSGVGVVAIIILYNTYLKEGFLKKPIIHNQIQGVNAGRDVNIIQSNNADQIKRVEEKIDNLSLISKPKVNKNLFKEKKWDESTYIIPNEVGWLGIPGKIGLIHHHIPTSFTMFYGLCDNELHKIDFVLLTENLPIIFNSEINKEPNNNGIKFFIKTESDEYIFSGNKETDDLDDESYFVFSASHPIVGSILNEAIKYGWFTLKFNGHSIAFHTKGLKNSIKNLKKECTL